MPLQFSKTGYFDYHTGTQVHGYVKFLYDLCTTTAAVVYHYFYYRRRVQLLPLRRHVNVYLHYGRERLLPSPNENRPDCSLRRYNH